MVVLIAAVLTAGYLIGCMHGSVVARLLTGTNLKKAGVKNSGASNAAIVLGWKYGALVAAVDIGKGAAAILLCRTFLVHAGYTGEFLWTLLFLTGAATVIGHNFPFYMGFDGGKGTASVIGVMLALDYKLGLAGGLLLIVIALITNYLVIGVLGLYSTLFIIAVFSAAGAGAIIISLFLFFMAVWKHRENFSRILSGTETKVSSVFRKKTTPSL